MNVGIQIDSSRLDAALSMAMQFTSRAPEKVIDSAAYYVVKRTVELTPFVPISRMDAELGTAVTLTPKKIGGGFLRAKRTTRYQSGRLVSVGQRAGGAVKPQSVPLAALIVNLQVLRPDVASYTPSSKNYNRRTNFRFARISSPFRGKSQAAGRSAMRAAVHRLIAARHSSSKFLVSGWAYVRRLLLGRVYGGAPAVEGGFVSNKDFGEISRSGDGINYSLTVSNLIGMQPGAKGSNAENYNRALHRYSGPALQQAMNEEADQKFAHYWNKIHREELQPKWEALCR